MIIGSGLLARAFACDFLQNETTCIYAAGVSNSGCTDHSEFNRERKRLLAALDQADQFETFVYFGTCSVNDPASQNTHYVQHKVAMEQLVLTNPKNIVFRLPQVAGKTPNPHTLLNYLYARISRSESFTVWRNATRNIIDVDDIVSIARYILASTTLRNLTLNIANPVNSQMHEILDAMETALGKTAIYEVVERGSGYPIDISPITPFIENAGVKFGDVYLSKVIGKYYGNIS